MTTEIAVREQHDTDSWVQMLPAVGELADAVNRTEFVPATLRGKAPAVAAAILAGREIGLPPMQSLQHIHIIEGRPTLSAQMQRSLALAAGYHLQIIETNTTRCIVEGRRSTADEWTRVTWTLDDAKKAGLLGRANWQKHPRRMLQARATAELCQLIFSDAIAGMAATEEIEDDAEGPAAVLVNGSEPPAQRTAQRRQRAAETGVGATRAGTREEDRGMGADRVKPSGSQRTDSLHSGGPDPSLPPLPGEDEDSGPAVSDRAEAAAGPGTSDRHQRLVGIVRAHFKRLDFADEEREQRLVATAVLAGVSHDLPTTSFLTEEQLSAVADTLSRCKDRDRLIALLVAGDKADA